MLGLCSNGVIDRKSIYEFIESHDDAKKSWITDNVIHGHETDYNQRDTTRVLEYCDETSEALANFTSARLLGESDIGETDKAQLPQSRLQSIKLVEKMTERIRQGFIWPN